jgi:protein tyrosine/serine phosphatase
MEDHGCNRRSAQSAQMPSVARSERHLDWDGCFNVRDLGDLRTTDGGETLWGSIVRADALEGLTAAGWAALSAHGVRTVIDLRNDDERGADVARRPASVRTVHLPLDCSEDREFWDVWDSGPQFGTPLYYRPHLERLPERSAAVVSAIARAGPGGVAFHCAGGRDRTGQVTMLALALVGVAPEDIAADYELSAHRLPARHAASGEENQAPLLEAFLADRGTTAREIIVTTLSDLDVEACLLDAGLTRQDVSDLRRRLLGPTIEETDTSCRR